MLDLANAQFIGYRHGINYDLITMVQSMGLNKKEWIKYKKKYPISSLREGDIKEIDDYFNTHPTDKQ